MRPLIPFINFPVYGIMMIDVSQMIICTVL